MTNKDNCKLLFFNIDELKFSRIRTELCKYNINFKEACVQQKAQDASPV
jgi:hypothetical protein